MGDFWAETDPNRPPPPPPPDPRRVRAEELLELAAGAEDPGDDAAPVVDELGPDDVAVAAPAKSPAPVKTKRPGPPRSFLGGHPLDQHDWAAIRAYYVEGVKDDQTGMIRWPSLAEAAEKHGASANRTRTRSATEGWAEKRRQYQAKVENTRQQARAAALAKHSLDLEGKALDVSKLGLQLVWARLTEIGQAAQARRSENFGSPGAGSGIDAQEQQRLAAAADLWQRIGLKALGETEVARVELTGAGGAPIEIAQELRRDDPDRLASVLSVLQRAGIEHVLGDVVDGETVDDDEADGSLEAG